MQVLSTMLPEVKIIRPKRFGDQRGWFSETWHHGRYSEAGIGATFVQDNAALSVHKGTVRGLHFQRPPMAQGKLIWVVRGAAFDVAVDLRVGSPRFGQHVAVTLHSETGEQLWIPAGFAHGYCTLEANTELVYKVTEFYNPELDGGIRWDDPALGISWPVATVNATLSAKDLALPLMSDIGQVFSYGRDS